MNNMLERFLEKTELNPYSGCILWTGAKVGTKLVYGQFWSKGKHILAHRFSFEQWHGRKIKEGMTIDHQCNNPLCVNPFHLKEMTLWENTLRGNASPAVNSRKTHCIRGHEFTLENTKPRKDGHRQCRICFNALQKKYYDKKALAKSRQEGGK